MEIPCRRPRPSTVRPRPLLSSPRSPSPCSPPRRFPAPAAPPIASAAVAVAAALLCVLGTAPARAAPTPADTGGWRWPLTGEPEVLRYFAPPAQRWLGGHRGVDLAADEGDEVVAAGTGRVAFAGRVAGTGAVSVVHGDLRTTYLPVEAAVERGTAVRAGDMLGTVADAPRHCAARSCLHWGLLRDRTYLDPLALLGMGEVRLLPVTGSGVVGRQGRVTRGGGPGCRRG
ncbi:murein DD-endopeptidase MepM/ murein hydrolase activator NlpD [Nocardiopsis mwathae]|uniref:Murein DD-endopeptidase MepM/ murein hydrolase activator NlpD n=1 Tax=Nocardiopsis mwathae TaxID=1472723 RepID=A0A7X0D695_9ACTN|nr:M23 family metallopeptidase [Nocardiopsis mwathae]MBB6173045.1 murein DD-endopeptidase MepM/ murein hydrolase activator NlpD [Nocardiopsis mwathae]